MIMQMLAALAAAQVAPVATASNDVAPTVAPAATTATLPALTPIVLTVDKALTSNTAVIGEEFDIELANPVAVGDRFIIPAGTKGRGFVIHASHSGLGGKPGELLLGARYLQLGDVRIPLRSMKVGSPSGKDNTGVSMAVSAVTPLGMFIGGGQARIATGMTATAKTASDIELPIALLAPAPTRPAGLVPAPPSTISPQTVSQKGN